MNGYVLDSSAVIALAKRETGWERVAPAVRGGMMTTPNLAEVVQHFVAFDANPDEAARFVTKLGVVAVAPDLDLAVAAGAMWSATRGRGLSLADRFCLALARRLGLPALTADRARAGVAAAEVRVELIR